MITATLFAREQRRVPVAVALIVGSQVAVLALDFKKVGLTSGGVDIGRWLVILPGQVLLGLLLLVTSHRLWEVIRRPAATAILVWLAWGLVTVFWSVDPAQTLLLSIGAVNLTLMGMWLAAVYGQRGFVMVVGGAITTIVGLGALYQWGGPGPGPGVRLEGLAEGTNQLATQCAYGLILVLAARSDRPTRPLWTAAAIALGCALVASGGRIALAGVFGALLYFEGRRFLPRRALLVGGLAAGVMAVGALQLVSNLSFYERADDSGLNGRDLIWGHASDLIGDHPFFGVGMMTGDRVWRAAVAQGEIDFTAGGAHNSLLEVMVGGGMVGTVLFLVAVGATLRNGWRHGKDLMVALGFLVLVMGTTESLIHRPSLTHVILGGAVALSGDRAGSRSGSRLVSATPAPTTRARP